MSSINIDLEDGLPPVRFSLNDADTARFVTFMADCRAAELDARRLNWLLDNCGTNQDGDHMNPPVAQITFAHYSPGVIGAGPSIRAAIDAAMSIASSLPASAS